MSLLATSNFAESTTSRERAMGLEPTTSSLGSGTKTRPWLRNALRINATNQFVVNFDVPRAPEDYIHRVERTARAEATGEAYTFAAPDEADELRAIERVVGKPLPRVTLPDFDYNAKPATKLERPIAERLAEHRARRATERARSAEKGTARPATAKQTAPRSESAPRTPSPYRDGSAPSGEGRKRRRRRRRR